MSMRPALALKAAEVAQDPEDHQGTADQGMAEEGRVGEVRAEEDAFS